MRIDPSITRRKVAAEITKIRQQSAILRAWGCHVIDTSEEQVDCVFVPKQFARISIPAQQRTPFGSPIGLATVELPVLAARAFGVRIGLDDFDVVPPSVIFCDPWTWQPLRSGAVPLGNHIEANGAAWNILVDPHPVSNRPFLCIKGTREYHSHPQHTGDDWMMYRGSIGVFYLISVIWNAFIQNSRPNVIWTGGSQIQVRWEYEKAPKGAR